MKSFPFEQLFLDYSIPYITHGENCAQGNVNINCPFCNAHGKPDHNYHMGVSLTGKGWGCWRAGDHRGKSPVSLIAMLMQVSIRQATAIASTYTKTTLDAFSSLGAAEDLFKLQDKEPESIDLSMEWPEGFILPDWNTRWTIPHLTYMQSRGFSGAEAESACAYYDIRVSQQSHWFNRMLIPVQSGVGMVGWSGRSIEQSPGLRWKMLSAYENKSPYRAISSNKKHLGNESNIMKGGKILILTEGQYDYLAIDYRGKKHGIRAGCFFTKSITAEQIALIDTLRYLYDKVYIMLDATTGLESRKMALLFDDIEQIKVPYGKDDAGELSRLQALTFTRQLSEEKYV